MLVGDDGGDQIRRTEEGTSMVSQCSAGIGRVLGFVWWFGRVFWGVEKGQTNKFAEVLVVE